MLDGLKILITGGSRGLGSSFCHTFASLGAKIAFTFNSDEKGAALTVEKVKSEVPNASVLSFKVSVLDKTGFSHITKILENEWGGIDVLVNNAGISQALPIALMDEEEWDQLIDTNLKGVYIASRSVLPGMIRKRNGVILNIGSLAGTKMIEAPVHYCASKAAIKGYTEALAKEVSRYNIRVNCLAPGLLEDGVAKNLPEYRLDEFLSHLALRRRGTFLEVSEFAALLISSQNTFMTGSTILMDGGF